MSNLRALLGRREEESIVGCLANKYYGLRYLSIVYDSNTLKTLVEISRSETHLALGRLPPRLRYLFTAVLSLVNGGTQRTIFHEIVLSDDNF